MVHLTENLGRASGGHQAHPGALCELGLAVCLHLTGLQTNGNKSINYALSLLLPSTEMFVAAGG